MSKKRIGVIGTGYVGLVTGACFADIGYEVTCLDIVEDKVNKINSGVPPIFENGLEEMLKDVVLERKLLRATLDRDELLANSDIIFLCLATPSSEDGSINLDIMTGEVREIANCMKDKDEYKVFVVKSTVVPGTTTGIVKDLLESQGKKAGEDFGLGMNPEFLMEGLAISNFSDPDRVVIGAIDDRSFEHINELYNTFTCEKMRTSPSAAEMIKYASNSFLALKISYINEIANISEKLEIDVGDVATGMGLDSRISSKFLRAGVGFGGSCFPKDVKALNYLSKQLGVPSRLLPGVLEVNKFQPLRVIDMLESCMTIEDSKICLLGLAFKPDTDDMREAASITIANELLKKGATVIGYDPIAKETAEEALPDITHATTAADALNGADACILVTEWKEFKDLSVDTFKTMKGKVIIDGRRILDYSTLRNNDFTVLVIGQANH
ncbi:MAG: UDP-glucose/GDP-mannose dehydrogenase family protein [Candidatus Heimdallarchaeota archaeon]|nr:UDP-glucose/GDP-mannose dehydrogenase family protein [Candidatus Heimdallarchaeota archaeon]